MGLMNNDRFKPLRKGFTKYRFQVRKEPTLIGFSIIAMIDRQEVGKVAVIYSDKEETKRSLTRLCKKLVKKIKCQQ